MIKICVLIFWVCWGCLQRRRPQYWIVYNLCNKNYWRILQQCREWQEQPLVWPYFYSTLSTVWQPTFLCDGILSDMVSAFLGLPRWLRQWRILLKCGRPGFDTWAGKIPWRRAWQPTPVFLENPPGERSWRSTVHRFAKSWIQRRLSSSSIPHLH